MTRMEASDEAIDAVLHYTLRFIVALCCIGLLIVIPNFFFHWF